MTYLVCRNCQVWCRKDLQYVSGWHSKHKDCTCFRMDYAEKWSYRGSVPAVVEMGEEGLSRYSPSFSTLEELALTKRLEG
jgi:hypothetical protein